METLINNIIEQIPKPLPIAGWSKQYGGTRKPIKMANILRKLSILITSGPKTTNWIPTSTHLQTPVKLHGLWMEGLQRFPRQRPLPYHTRSLQTLHEDRLPHEKINKINWEVFETLYKQKLIQNPNIKNLTKHFTENLISIAKETIAKTSASNKHNTHWLNDDCRTAIRLRKVLFTNPSARAGYDTRSIFKRSLTGFEFRVFLLLD